MKFDSDPDFVALPDSRGLNLYRADPGYAGLLGLYLPPSLHAHAAAHLGSIWEGTSNIVALDVLRAIRREDALAALEPALEALLPRSDFGAALGRALGRACSFAAGARRGPGRGAAGGNPARARRRPGLTIAPLT